MGRKNIINYRKKNTKNPQVLTRPQKNSQILIFIILWMFAKIGETAFRALVFFTQIVVVSIKTYFKNLTVLVQLLLRPFFRKHRGRPRKKPIHLYWLSKLKKLIRIIFPTPLRIAVFAGFFVLGMFFYSLFLIIVAHDLPAPNSLSHSQSPQTTEFFDRKGRLLYRLYEGKNRTPIKLAEVPKDLINATIAIEDKNFYAHSGIDFYGIARAAMAFLQESKVQGGSTITQQLIKNTLLTPERTLTRKFKEIQIAFWTEKIYSKDEILQMYFNEVPYGGPAWGIAAAAQTYFNKNAGELNLAESSYLAGLPVSPTTYSPYGSNPELGKQRQKEVLRRMVEDGYITQKQADDAFAIELKINPPINKIEAPHFVMYVRSLLSKKYGDKLVSQGGLKVYTTLDLDIQEYAEKIVQDEVSSLNPLHVTNGAAMVTDAKTGYILAMVGSKNYWDPNGGNFNVTIARRQPGSSIKPITYATGFKNGYSPGSILLDTPITYASSWERYSPVNYDGRFHGPVTIRTALGSSYNVPAVKMLASVGLDKMIQTARDLGITTFDEPERYGLSLTLGGGEVKLIEMMGAYGAFSQNGIKFQVQPVIKILDSDGNTLEDNSIPEGTRVLPAGVAYMISDILADNKARIPAFGPNSLLNIPGKTIAVKTGTTDNKRDNWTFGYTAEYVVGVWVGNNNNEPMDPKLTSGITGASPIWNKIINKLLEGRPNVAFERPPEIKIGIVSGNRDLVLSDKGTTGRISFTDPLNTYAIESSRHYKSP